MALENLKNLSRLSLSWLTALLVLISCLPAVPVSALVLDESPEEPAALQGFSTSISVDGEVFLFSSQLAAPNVTIAVTATGCMLTDDLNVHTWTYTGDGEFLGISLSPDGDDLVPVGSYVECPGNSSSNVQYTFYAIESSSSSLKAILSAGQWECKSLVMTGELVDLEPWPEGFSSQDISFSSNGKTFDSMSYQLDAVFGYCIFYDETLAYKYSDLTGQAAPSWVNKAYSLIYLESDQLVSQEFLDWFTTCFARVGSVEVEPTYYTTVNLYDSTGMVQLHTFTFSGEGAAPAPFLEVTYNGCVIYSGDQSTTWTTTDAFFGFTFDTASSALYVPGDTYILPGGGAADIQIDLRLCTEPSGDYFSTFIVVGSEVFEFTSTEGFPAVEILLYSTSVQFRDVSSGKLYNLSFTLDPGQKFLGFALQPDGVVVYSVPGVFDVEDPPTFQGSEDAPVLFLYPVLTPSSGSGSDDGSLDDTTSAISRMIGSLFGSLDVFFGTEILPGFTFGRICMSTFLVGLLFLFLKLVK